MADTDVLIGGQYKCPTCRHELCVIDVIGEVMVYCHHCRSKIRVSITPADGHRKFKKHRITIRANSVEIDGVKVMGDRAEKARQVFEILCKQFLKDAARNRLPDEYEGFTGRELANLTDWDEMNVRQAITRLRKRIRDEMKEQCKILVGNSDIIENMRCWRGYRCG